MAGISKGWWVLLAVVGVCAIAFLKTAFQARAVQGQAAPAVNQRNDSERTRQAILRVMKADEQLSKKFKEAPPNLAPGQIAWLIEQYCVALERLDMSDCPSDFRVAYKQHMRAWREAHVAVNEIPDGFVDGLVVGFMNGLVRGERDGGLGRMESKLRNAEDRIRTTWEVVERIAGQYGAVL